MVRLRLALSRHHHRAQFKELIEALHAFMTPPQPKKRPIGFITPEDR